MPAAAIAPAVPPLEMSFHPRSWSADARSTTPVLSYTESKADGIEAASHNSPRATRYGARELACSRAIQRRANVASVDISKFKTSDWLKMGGALGFLIFGFFDWISVDYEGAGISVSSSGG